MIHEEVEGLTDFVSARLQTSRGELQWKIEIPVFFNSERDAIAHLEPWAHFLKNSETSRKIMVSFLAPGPLTLSGR